MNYLHMLASSKYLFFFIIILIYCIININFYLVQECEGKLNSRKTVHQWHFSPLSSDFVKSISNDVNLTSLCHCYRNKDLISLENILLITNFQISVIHNSITNVSFKAPIPLLTKYENEMIWGKCKKMHCILRVGYHSL